MLPIHDCRQVEVACPQDFRSLLLMKCSPVWRGLLLATQMAVWGCQAVVVWCLGTTRSWERCSRRGTRAMTEPGGDQDSVLLLALNILHWSQSIWDL